jgi:hypothetical protein
LFRDVGKREGFAGLGVVGIVQRLQADQRLQKQLTDEGLAGFRRLAGNLPTVQAAIVAAEKAKAGNLAAATAMLPGQVPEVEAAIEAQRASARAEAAGTGLGVRGLRAEAAISGVQGGIRGEGFGAAFRRWMAGVAGNWSYFASFGDEEVARQAAQQWADPRFGWRVAPPRTEKLLESIDRKQRGGAVPMPEH